jgi:hypothetical protein
MPRPLVDTEQSFQLRMQVLIKELRADEELSYKELAKRLEHQGFSVDAKVLANRVNRGNFSAGFALAVLQALGYNNLAFPKAPKRLKASR